VYSYTFRIFDQSHLLVTVKEDATGTETTLTITTDYTVDGVGVAAGGNVTLVDGGQDWIDASGDLDSGWTMVIRRVIPVEQTADLRNQGQFNAVSHEDALDKGIMIAQQLTNDITGSIRLAETDDPASIDVQLPPLVASKYLQVNTAADGIQLAELAVASATISYPTTSGIAIYDGNGTMTTRDLAGTDGLSATNTDGLGGNPTVGIVASGVTLARMAADSVDEEKIVSTALGNGLSGASGDVIAISPDSATGATVAPLSVGANGAGVAVDNSTIVHTGGTLSASTDGNLQVATFTFTHVSGASSTGALSFEPKLAIYMGAFDNAASTLTGRTTGFATGTGTAMCEFFSINDAGTAPTTGTDLDSIGGIETGAGGYRAAATSELNVTVFSKAAGIELTWAGTDVPLGSHQGFLVVLG